MKFASNPLLCKFMTSLFQRTSPMLILNIIWLLFFLATLTYGFFKKWKIVRTLFQKLSRANLTHILFYYLYFSENILNPSHQQTEKHPVMESILSFKNMYVKQKHIFYKNKNQTYNVSIQYFIFREKHPHVQHQKHSLACR